MRTLITFSILAGLTIAVYFYFHKITPMIGRDVDARFIERLDTIPSSAEVISEASLGKWIASHPMEANGYLSPVIFPLDFFFMFTLSGALALLCIACADSLPFLRNIHFLVWAALPVLYLVADLCEDSQMVWILSLPERLNSTSYSVLRAFTAIKLITVKASFVEAGVLVVLAAGYRLFGFVRTL